MPRLDMRAAVLRAQPELPITPITAFDPDKPAVVRHPLYVKRAVPSDDFVYAVALSANLNGLSREARVVAAGVFHFASFERRKASACATAVELVASRPAAFVSISSCAS